MSSSTSRVRRVMGAIAIAASVVGPTDRLAAQVCAGLPATSPHVVTLVAGGRHDQPPFTDLQYIGIGYSRSAGERLTVSGFGQIPMLFPIWDFRRVAGEVAVVIPRTVGPGCPVLTAGYSASSGTLDASPHLSIGYGLGRRWDRSVDESDHTWFAFYAVPGVLLDRKQDFAPGGTGSARIRFATDLGFLASLGAHLYLKTGVRRAFLDGGGTSLEFGLGWKF